MELIFKMDNQDRSKSIFSKAMKTKTLNNLNLEFVNENS